jgi:undecaprenyl-diphosphatase
LAALVRRDFSDHALKFALGIVIGTIPIGMAGLALARLLNTCSSPLRGLEVVGAACIAMALLLGLAELTARHIRSFDRVGLLDCLFVGIAQAGALIPGVSRSGSTLTAALFLGFRREEAARFSFLLGLPAIALAGLKELKELRHAGLEVHGWAVLGVGLLVASLSAFVAIWGLLRILERFSAWPFAAYRALIGAALLAGVATGWLV